MRKNFSNLTPFEKKILQEARSVLYEDTPLIDHLADWMAEKKLSENMVAQELQRLHKADLLQCSEDLLNYGKYVFLLVAHYEDLLTGHP